MYSTTKTKKKIKFRGQFEESCDALNSPATLWFKMSENDVYVTLLYMFTDIHSSSCCTQWHCKWLDWFWHSAQKTWVLHRFQRSCQCIFAALLFSLKSAPVCCVFLSNRAGKIRWVGIKRYFTSHKSINIICFSFTVFSLKKKSWR